MKNKKQLLLETNALGVCLGASLLQAKGGMQFPRNEAQNNAVLQPVVFASKSLTSTDTHCSSVEIEALGMLHGLEIIHHYCFSHDVSVITDHKLLVAVFKKDVASLSHRL